MAEVINAKAGVGRIEEHVRRSLRAARARGGVVAEAAESRLGPAVEAIDAALALRKATEDTEATAWEGVLAADAKSDVGIGGVRDAMWNALGRPGGSPLMEQVYPGGVSVYTSGDPRGQPVLMQILRSRILSASAPQWTEALRAGWAAEIETLRTGYEAAIDAHRPAEAAALVASAGYRSTVRTGHARLRAFKRDLLNLGLSDPQVHEIIPDASVTTAAPSAPAAATSAGAGAASTADKPGGAAGAT